MGLPGIGGTRHSTRHDLACHPFYLHHRRCLGKAPPHREVSLAVISSVHGGAMGWSGLNDMIRSTCWQRHDARRVTTTPRNYGAGDIIRLGPGHA